MKRLALLLLLTTSTGFCGTVNVNIADPVLLADFTAFATNFYQGTLVKSPYFADTYSLTITAKKTPVIVTPPPPPPPPPPPTGGTVDLSGIMNALAYISSCTYPYGFANGMDTERLADIQMLYEMQGRDFARKTCMGQTIPVTISSTTAMNLCLHGYDVMASTFSQRWQYVFTSTGGIVAK